MQLGFEDWPLLRNLNCLLPSLDLVLGLEDLVAVVVADLLEKPAFVDETFVAFELLEEVAVVVVVVEIVAFAVAFLALVEDFVVDEFVVHADSTFVVAAVEEIVAGSAEAFG